MIYLCSAYSLNADKELMQKRYEYAAKRTAEFLKKGITVFSPITHCHTISNKYGFPKDFSFWQQHDFTYIKAAKKLYVLKMPGWEQSKGVTKEIAYAKFLGKPIEYIEATDYSEEE